MSHVSIQLMLCTHLLLEHFIFLGFFRFISCLYSRDYLLNELAPQSIVAEGEDAPQLPHISEVDLHLLKSESMQMSADPFLDEHCCLFRREHELWLDGCSLIEDLGMWRSHTDLLEDCVPPLIHLRGLLDRGNLVETLPKAILVSAHFKLVKHLSALFEARHNRLLSLLVTVSDDLHHLQRRHALSLEKVLL